ncbi:hypothetical protein LEMLEM_LOCUS15066, partial [Lemmus lemmus]
MSTPLVSRKIGTLMGPHTQHCLTEASTHYHCSSLIHNFKSKSDE